MATAKKPEKKTAAKPAAKKEVKPAKATAKPAKATAKPAAKKETKPAAKPAAKPAPKAAKKPEVKEVVNKNYHISQRDDGKWQVKGAKAEKALKIFNTQAEAIKYAKTTAGNQDGSFTIHKKDGKIRKQTY
ncbi:MAG: DUF2188 domain-containing protein [Clostridia bacterium]|nr:DUF2188 domain-containing protein [Clostridia bacterium]